MKCTCDLELDNIHECAYELFEFGHTFKKLSMCSCCYYCQEQCIKDNLQE